MCQGFALERLENLHAQLHSSNRIEDAISGSGLNSTPRYSSLLSDRDLREDRVASHFDLVRIEI